VPCSLALEGAPVGPAGPRTGQLGAAGVRLQKGVGASIVADYKGGRGCGRGFLRGCTSITRRASCSSAQPRHPKARSQPGASLLAKHDTRPPARAPPLAPSPVAQTLLQLAPRWPPQRRRAGTTHGQLRDAPSGHHLLGIPLGPHPARSAGREQAYFTPLHASLWRPVGARHSGRFCSHRRCRLRLRVTASQVSPGWKHLYSVISPS
jgi:hypothetical protein